MLFSILYSVLVVRFRFLQRTLPILTLLQILLILSAVLSYISRYPEKVAQKSSSYFGNFGSAFGTASNGANRPAPYPSELAALSQILLLRITNRITGNMPTFTLDDLDQHIENLRSQLQFLNGALEATDHKAPDWLATDLVSLRNKSGRLQDDMQRFRDQLDSEGLAKKKKNRLSLEGAKASNDVAAREETPAQDTPQTSPSKPAQPSQSATESPQIGSYYVAQHMDVTEEVNRRLRESRLRRLMDSPSTSLKRKYDAFDETRTETSAGTEDDGDGGSDRTGTPGTPTKRIKSYGSFEAVSKRGVGRARDDDGEDDRVDYKRRRIWSGRA